MKLLIILIFSIQLFTTICFGINKNENKEISDTTEIEGIISIKLGYFPFHSKLKSAGVFASISTNGDFQSFFDFGWYFSIYGGKRKPGSESGLIFGGFNLGHKFNINNRYLMVKLVTGLAFSGSYPTIANVVEFDFPLLLLFERTSIDLSISFGIIRFTTMLPITFSLGYTF